MQITAHTTLVEPKSEALFNATFWRELTFVITALDNIRARECVAFFWSGVGRDGFGDLVACLSVCVRVCVCVCVCVGQVRGRQVCSVSAPID